VSDPQDSPGGSRPWPIRCRHWRGARRRRMRTLPVIRTRADR